MAAISPVAGSAIPSPPAKSDSYGMSTLSSLLSLLALITIPTLIYAVFFAIKCPNTTHSPFRRSRRSTPGDPAAGGSTTGNTDLVPGSSLIKYEKEARGKDRGDECPVCLSAFGAGEEVLELGTCKHWFHVGCITKWLKSHSSCPVCRASIITTRRSKPPAPVNAEGEGDFRQGLPDSASLV